MTQVLLIHPPVAKPGEPPVGIARLKGFLDHHLISCETIDANLEAILYLFQHEPVSKDRWTRQASRKKDSHLQAIKNGTAFKSADHYNRIVRDLNRLVNQAGQSFDYQLGLADCAHIHLSPAQSQNLIHCAEKPEANPFYDYYQNKLIPVIEKNEPEWIGLSVNFLSQALCGFALAGTIRKKIPRIKIITGGGLITSWMQNPDWANPFQGLLDHCVAGPGESFFADCFQIDAHKKSVCRPVFNENFLLEYLSPGFVLPYNTSMGCYWRKCRFCPECAEGHPYHPIDHQTVLEDLNTLTTKTNPSLIHFLDDAISPSFLEKWVKQSAGIPWYGYVRFTDHLMDLDFCQQMKNSGCAMLKLGLESGDQAVLDQMHKGIDLRKASKILANLKKTGISTYIYLLFGTPYENEKAAYRTLKFAEGHHNKIGFINAAIFYMPILSEETELVTTFYFSEGDLSLYVNFRHPGGWNRTKVRHFIDRIFKRNPVIAPILQRTPKVFTSNHAPFFMLNQQ